MSLCRDGRQGLCKNGSLGNNNKASEIFVQSDYLILVGMGVKIHASIRRSTVHAATAVFDWFQKQGNIKHSNFQFILSNKLSKNLNTSQYAKRNYQKCDNGTQHHISPLYAQESKCFQEMYNTVWLFKRKPNCSQTVSTTAVCSIMNSGIKTTGYWDMRF